MFIIGGYILEKVKTFIINNRIEMWGFTTTYIQSNMKEGIAGGTLANI